VFLQEAVAVAFVVLGIATAYHWLRRRDGSIAFLALAIILLAAVVGLAGCRRTCRSRFHCSATSS